jgi:hypothetical protein
MAAVNEWIVREYFEFHGFFVMQPRKYQVPGRAKTAEEEIDLIICRPNQSEQRLPDRLVWTGADLGGVARAVVGVRGWHTERFSANTFEQAPDILRFAEADVVRRAEKRFGADRVAKVLCLPQLPATPELRDKALAFLKERGVDGVLPFRTLLQELIRMIDVNRNYEKSDVLQVVRVFKAYGLLTPDAQMDLFERKKRGGRAKPRRKTIPEPGVEPGQGD